MSTSNGDAPPGIWPAVLVGFVTLLAFSLLFLVASLLAGEIATGLGFLALTILIGWIEWRAWRRATEVTVGTRARGRHRGFGR